ncbi:MAG: hypothetical protein J7K54_01925 [Candidatus Aenigmarchaeota archaeon]|nr:hypothetical protein [Candidatus Aenigmarchaeota archaeon]
MEAASSSDQPPPDFSSKLWNLYFELGSMFWQGLMDDEKLSGEDAPDA